MKKITVIILLYNNSLDSILMTLKSIIKQDFIDYDIILADDSSQKQYWNEIEFFLKQHSFTEYHIIKNKRNIGTVRNYLNAAIKASGKYLKPIGPGDFFYDENTLLNIYNFLETNEYDFGFGLLKSYKIGTDGFIYENGFTAPIDINPYVNYNYNKIKKNIVLRGDYICGATMFGKREFIIEYLNKVSYSSRITEDIMQVLVALDEKPIPLLNEYILFYEVGTGISTKRKVDNKKDQLTIDQELFWKYIKNNYSNDSALLNRADGLLKVYNSKGKIKKNIIMMIYDFPGFCIKTIRKYQRNKKGLQIREGFLKGDIK